MDPITTDRLRKTFLALASNIRENSPLYGALCAGLGADPGPVVIDLFDRFGRITSSTNLNVMPLLAGLHLAALRGDAPELAAYFPSCGGDFRPADVQSLITAATDALAANREDLLNFMLSHDLEPPVVKTAAPVLLGALTTVRQFGGGLSLVELGCGGGLNLLLDQYAYQFGEASPFGDGAPHLQIDVLGGEDLIEDLLGQGLPPIVGRRGLDRVTSNLADPQERLLYASYLWPDQMEPFAAYQQAVDQLQFYGGLDLRQGAPESATSALLVEAYNAMEPGNTLFIFDTFFWAYLIEGERKAIALSVQRLAAQIQPHKPIAWLQVDRFAPGPAEIRLHTFGWTDQEDRTVRKLGDVDPDLRWIRWHP